MNIDKIVSAYPGIKKLIKKLEAYESNTCYPPGHYYSPIYSVEELKEREAKIWSVNLENNIPGIDLNIEEQLALVLSFEKYYNEMPFGKKKQLRYSFNNNFYSYTDGITLYSILRHYSPKKVIEVGSGYSSALMLDTKEYFNMATEFTFIEPNPDRLLSLIKANDHSSSTVISQMVQELDAEFFTQLERNDILFIDSSHVVKTGGDLNYLLFNIIPAIKSGVLVHFHDIFFPFEYPKKWVYAGRNWNENYFIRAFLSYNKAFKILIFAHYLHLFHSEIFKNMPLFYKNAGGNIWLEKL